MVLCWFGCGLSTSCKVRSSAGSAPATAGLQPGKSSDHCISGAGGIEQLSFEY